MVKQLNLQQLTRVGTFFLCMMLLVSYPIQVSASSYCSECDYECDPVGFWQSRGAGYRAAVIGGSIAGVVVASLIAASAINGGNSGSSSSLNYQSSSTVDNTAFILANGGALPNTDIINAGNVGEDVTTTLGGTELLGGGGTTDFGDLNLNEEILADNLGTTVRNKRSPTKKTNKILRKTSCQACHAKEETLTVEFSLSLSANDLITATITPLVVCPDGRIIEGFPVAAVTHGNATITAPIKISNPCKGSYQIGFSCSTTNYMGYLNADLENTIIDSRHHSSKTIGNISTNLNANDMRIVNEFSIN